MKKIPWIIQILISLTIIFFLFKHFKSDLDWFAILMFAAYIFIALTKIPLSSAIYYSKKIIWKIIFSILLLILIISDFETIITTFELSDLLSSKSIEIMILSAGILALASPLIAFVVFFIGDKKK